MIPKQWLKRTEMHCGIIGATFNMLNLRFIAVRMKQQIMTPSKECCRVKERNAGGMHPCPMIDMC